MYNFAPPANQANLLEEHISSAFENKKLEGSEGTQTTSPGNSCDDVATRVFEKSQFMPADQASSNN